VKVALLAGGTGGAKLAHGFQLAVEPGELSVIVNVADDTELFGLHVSPDIDSITYTLAGLLDRERGWGVRDDTFTALELLGRYGAPTWFRIGDADLATHVRRTQLLGDGASLTDATAAMASALGVPSRILPATDDRLRTRVVADDGELDFQEYFVGRRQEPEVRGVRLDGIDAARPTAAVLDAIVAAELVVIAPSNPIVSIGPILELPGMRDAIRAARAPKVAVSPIIGGRALKGPADRMLLSLGHESSALGVARLYAGLVDRFVLDETDAGLAPAVESVGLAATALQTVMASDDDRVGLARALIASAVPG
jgi:LPPG:FO 2-phospho-L-lactate transferase